MKKSILIDMLEGLAAAKALTEYSVSHITGQSQEMVRSAKFRIEDAIHAIKLELKK